MRYGLKLYRDLNRPQKLTDENLGMISFGTRDKPDCPAVRYSCGALKKSTVGQPVRYKAPTTFR
jgi:hypothetical protein